MDRRPAARTLTIAGSDSGGGAGIQADLKTFSAFGAYGMTAITGVTAQNTVGVQGIELLKPEFVAAQIESVLTDIGCDAAKTGMLGSAGIVEAVGDCLRRHQAASGTRLRLVVDPVMVAKSGDSLLLEEARDALRQALLPLALAVTPNIPEAEILSGRSCSDARSVREAARAIHAMGPAWVIIKGGHLSGDAVDIAFNGKEFLELRAERIPSRNTHGTGCTFSAALTALLARGWEMPRALEAAKRYVTDAIACGLPLGNGHGPTHHLYGLAPAEGWSRP